MLTLITFAPLVGIPVILFLPKSMPNAVRGVALATAAFSFILSWSLLFSFDRSSSELQFAQSAEWIPVEGMTYDVGVDGLSFPLLLLSTLVSLVAIAASFGIQERIKGYFAWFLLLNCAIMGIFVAQDWFLFYVFYELALIPMFFLIGLWGSGNRDFASMSFFLYTLGGSIFMLLGILSLYLLAPEPTFNMRELAAASGDLSLAVQIGPFIGFLLGFAVKIPIFGMHGWLPIAHVEAPTPASMVLSGTLLKTGAYGLIRAGETLPLAIEWCAVFLFALGLVNVVYGALLALRATDMKAMVAFSSISHMGFVVLGISALSTLGLTGALMMMLTHGIIISALFMLVGFLYERAHTRDLMDFGGLGVKVPIFTALMSLSLLASMGLPGLAGFVSEFHVIVGAFQSWGLFIVFGSLGILFAAAYSLRAIEKLFLGEFNERWSGLPDLTFREVATVAPLAVLMVVLGVYPGPVLDLMEATLVQMSALWE